MAQPNGIAEEQKCDECGAALVQNHYQAQTRSGDGWRLLGYCVRAGHLQLNGSGVRREPWDNVKEIPRKHLPSSILATL